MKLRYFSHSAFQITCDDGLKILIDPFFDNNPTSPVKAEDVEADYILISHGHWDHLGDTLDIAQRCNALCICENELASYLDAKGLNVHKMHIGGAFEFDFGRIKLTQALHSSVTPDNVCHGTPTGFVITINGTSLYHTGDTGLFSDMKLIGQLNNIHTMMVPIGDNFTMGIEDAAMACDFVKPVQAVPMHYNTFDLIRANPEDFCAKISANGIECKIMNFGDQISIQS